MTSEAFVAARHAYYQAEYVKLGLTLPALPKPKPAPRHAPALAPPLLPPPSGAYLGRYHDTGEPFQIDAEQDLVGGLWLLGKNGSGKTVTIERLIMADIAAGRAVICLDPAGDLTDNVMRRIPDERLCDVILLDAADPDDVFSLNPVCPRDPENDDLIAQQGQLLAEFFRKLTESTGANLEDIIPNAAYTLLYNPGHTLLDLDTLLEDATLRQRLSANVRNVVVLKGWSAYDKKRAASQAMISDSTLKRVRQATRDPKLQRLIGQRATTVDFDRWMAERKIVLVRLPADDLTEDTLLILGTLVLQQIKFAAYNRMKLPEQLRHPVMLYVDEFPLFATRDFGEMFYRARKTGVRTVLAHQDLAQLPAEMRAIPKAAQHFFCYGVSADDARYAVSELPIPAPRATTFGSRDPIRDIKRSPGHPNPRALTLVHQAEQILEFGVLASTAGKPDSFDRAYQEGFWNAVTRYLIARQEGHAVARETRSSIRRYLGSLVSRERSRILRSVLRELGDLLEGEPITLVNERVDPQLKAGQMRQLVHDQLVGFDVFEAYAKVSRGRRRTIRRVTMEPLPWAHTLGDTDWKRQQIRQQMRELGITRPRQLIERALERRAEGTEVAADRSATSTGPHPTEAAPPRAVPTRTRPARLSPDG